MKMPLMTRLAEGINAYPFVLLFLLLLSWFALYLFLPVEYQRDILAPHTEDARVYLGNKLVVWQEFKPHVGLSGIDIPIGSDTYPNSPLILHIRPTIDGEDLA